LQIICIRAAMWKILSFMHPALMSKGKVKVLLKLQIIFVPIYITTIVLSVSYGLEVMLWSVTVFSFFRLLISLKILTRELKIKMLELNCFIKKNILITLICLIGVYFFEIILSYSYGDIELLIITSFIFSLLLFMSVLITKHPVYLEILKILKI